MTKQYYIDLFYDKTGIDISKNKNLTYNADLGLYSYSIHQDTKSCGIGIVSGNIKAIYPMIREDCLDNELPKISATWVRPEEAFLRVLGFTITNKEVDSGVNIISGVDDAGYDFVLYKLVDDGSFNMVSKISVFLTKDHKDYHTNIEQIKQSLIMTNASYKITYERAFG